MKVLVLASSSVSVKLLPKLMAELYGVGAEIRYMMTEKAQIFVHDVFGLGDRVMDKNCGHLHSIEDFSSYVDFKKECLVYKYPGQFQKPKDYVVHVDNAKWADVILVCPATANTIAKMNHGICDNVIMDTLLVASGLGRRIIVAPAMNTHMWESWQNQRNILSLKDEGVEFVFPTVKRLACGDYGIGALADIKAIVDRVLGIRWNFPLHTYFNNRFIPVYPHLGGFGAVRRFDIHNGVDIYCEGDVDVSAVEDGEVVEVGQFTGKDVGSPWWNDTWYVTVKGHSGYVVYGETVPIREMIVGAKVKRGQKIAFVTPVLKTNKVRKDIKGHSDHMLHIELKRELVHDGGWPLNTERPKELLDPTAYLI